MGLGCWALDMPFMNRTSPKQLKKNPRLKGKDLETTRRSCAKFKYIPTSIINYVEGSRFTKENTLAKVRHTAIYCVPKPVVLHLPFLQWVSNLPTY